jgi:hypothetical protein
MKSLLIALAAVGIFLGCGNPNGPRGSYSIVVTGTMHYVKYAVTEGYLLPVRIPIDSEIFGDSKMQILCSENEREQTATITTDHNGRYTYFTDFDTCYLLSHEFATEPGVKKHFEYSDTIKIDSIFPIIK